MVYQASLCVWCPWSYLVYFMSCVWLYLVDASQMSPPMLRTDKRHGPCDTSVATALFWSGWMLLLFCPFDVLPNSNLCRRLIFVVEVYPKNWQSASFSFSCYLRLFSISNFFLTDSIKMSQNLLLDHPQSAWDLLRVCVFLSLVSEVPSHWRL